MDTQIDLYKIERLNTTENVIKGTTYTSSNIKSCKNLNSRFQCKSIRYSFEIRSEMITTWNWQNPVVESSTTRWNLHKTRWPR
jgi:hypothetical protein